jgi:hypothetical protein
VRDHRGSEREATVTVRLLPVYISRQPSIDDAAAAVARGLGLPLLLHDFGEFFSRGVTSAGLSVGAHGRTAAPRRYQRAGMHVTQNFLLHRKDLRPGVDLGMRMATD